MDNQIGFMLFKGPDDKPDFFCGYQLVNNNMTPQFESSIRSGINLSPTKPVLFKLKSDAIDSWNDLAKHSPDIKIELMQIKAGYCQFERQS